MGHSLPLFCPWRGWVRGLPNPKGHKSACSASPENSHPRNLQTWPCARALAPAPVLGPRGAPGIHAGSSVLRPQCRPSKGRKRGFCWCVDKYGQPLPGYDARAEGDVQCFGAEGN